LQRADDRTPEEEDRDDRRPRHDREGQGAARYRHARSLAPLAGASRDPEWRRYGYLSSAGRCSAWRRCRLDALLSNLAGSPAQADDVVLKGNDVVNPLNHVWTLVAAFLVFGMQAGFTFLEVGFCRSRERVNVLMECVVDTCLCGILFYAWGFAFMFGAGTPLFGTRVLLPAGRPATYGSTGVAFLAFWLFQFAFADTCSTITSGAMIGRTGFVGDLIYSLGVSGFIYPIIGHWAWGRTASSRRWAATGTSSRRSARASTTSPARRSCTRSAASSRSRARSRSAAPRTAFKRDGGGPMLPHDLTIATVGGFILWFGWYGFNPGSTLSAMDFEGIGRVAANTTLAACAAGCRRCSTLPEDEDLGRELHRERLPRRPRRDHLPLLLGVADGRDLLGGIAGVIVVVASTCSSSCRIDDPIGAVPVLRSVAALGTLFARPLRRAGSIGARARLGSDNSARSRALLRSAGFTVSPAQMIGAPRSSPRPRRRW
jgi:Amt family ammonium transporter